jgi:hypothetical protein
LVSAAVVQKEHRGVSDPDQAWILGELIRYLEHPRSGALAFDDMGSAWVGIREQVANGTLRAGDKGIAEVTSRFDALLTFIALQLRRRLGTDVTVQMPRKEQTDFAARQASLKASLLADGELRGALRVKDTIGDIAIAANLRTGKVTAHVDVEAPKSARQVTRVTWLTRQLKDARGSLRIEAFSQGQRSSTAAELLDKVREVPEALVADAAKELKSFRVAAITTLGTKRGRGRGNFIDSVIEVVDMAYEDVVQKVKPWSSPAPRLRRASGELPDSDSAAEALSEEAAALADSEPDEAASIEELVADAL